MQRETLDLCREVEKGPRAYEERDEEEPYESLAITLSNTANVVLLIIKVFPCHELFVMSLSGLI